MKKSKFLPALIIYSLVLIAIIGSGLFVLNKFLVAYEASRPDNCVAAYFEKNGKDFWLSGIHSRIKEGYSEFSNPDAVAADFGLDENADVTWRSAGTDGNIPLYKVKLGPSPVATIRLAPDTELDFGFHSWKVDTCTFDVGKDSSVTISVPAGCTPYINDVAVSDSYLTGTGITGVTLGEDFDIAPGSNIYTVDGLRGPVSISAFDPKGTELEPEEISGNEVAFLCEPEYETSFYAAANTQVFINGTEVTGRHVSSVGGTLHESVSILYYEFSGLYAEPEISVLADNEKVSPTDLSLGKCYIPGASAEADESLSKFLDDYVRAYVAFMTNKDKQSESNFANLSGYLERGTSFYRTCYNTIEPMTWVTTSRLKFNSIGCYDIMPMPNGDIVCHITYDVSYVHSSTPRDVVSDYLVLVRPSGSSYKIVDMNPNL